VPAFVMLSVVVGSHGCLCSVIRSKSNGTITPSPVGLHADGSAHAGRGRRGHG
jgi:hypothetical protein